MKRSARNIMVGASTMILVVLTACSGAGAESGAPGGGSSTTTHYFVYTANLASNSVSAYAIDTTTGALTPVTGSLSTSSYPTGDSVSSAPVSVAVDAAGPFVYVSNTTGVNGSVSAYVADLATGTLTPVTGTLSTSSYATGSNPKGIAILVGS